MKSINLFKGLGFIFLCLMIVSCQEDSFDVPIENLNDVDVSSKRTCLSEEHTQHMLLNEDYRRIREEKLSAFRKVSAQKILKSHCATPTLVPVAIHFQDVGNVNASCLRQLAVDQINRVNLDFSGHNADISNWTSQAASQFPGISNGAMCIQFVIGDRNHPSGYGLSDGDLAITINRTQGDQVNNWSGYLNIFVQTNTGALGYSPLGGFGNGDGVVIDVVGFGAGNGCGGVAPEAPFNLGRTLTHEIGHYLLLDHIWGNGCGVDDEVSDTPDQASDYSGCPTIGASSCGSVDMHMNYMDYTNDACMYMFSAGQVARMTNYLTSSLGNLVSNASNVLSGGGNQGGGDPGNEDPGGEDPGNEDPNICQSPTSSTVTVRNATSVRVDWDDIPGAIRYRIRYRLQGSGSWQTKSGVNSQKNLNGLVDGSYEYQLRTRCQVGGWQPWAGIETFDFGDNGGGSDPGSGDQITIRVTLDDYGSETEWFLYDEVNTLLESGGPYSDGLAGQTKSKSVTLSNGCYEIDLYDSYGDGICCDYGQGKLEILYGSSVLASSDGQFGTYELVQFCVQNGSARIINRQRDAKRQARGIKTK